MIHESAALPPADARTPLHTRTITYQGFRRDDGLWDFEATIDDRKQHGFTSYDGDPVPPGAPIHRMQVRLTVDDALVIRDVATAMAATPYPECQGAVPPMRRLIGARLGSGWRKALDDALGGDRGCTHVRETLLNIATVALQTVPLWRALQSGRDRPADWTGDKPPPFVGGCHGWRLDGPVVARHFPRFLRTPADE